MEAHLCSTIETSGWTRHQLNKMVRTLSSPHFLQNTLDVSKAVRQGKMQENLVKCGTRVSGSGKIVQDGVNWAEHRVAVSHLRRAQVSAL